jgi:hypothetical protein
VHRALAINRDAFATGQHTALRAAGVPGVITSSAPDGRPSLEAGDTIAFPATEADEKALADLDEHAEADKETLWRCVGSSCILLLPSRLAIDEQQRTILTDRAPPPPAPSVFIVSLPRLARASWSLDAWQLADVEVQWLCCSMLHSMGLLRRFSIQPTHLAALVSDVAARYNANPFHSFRHAFTVMHTCWLFLNTSVSLRRQQLQDLDWLTLLLAALCHDLEHPGTTNAFQVNTRSPLALRYNDTSVLENHHCCAGFAALERSGVLGGLAPACMKAFRKHFVAAVLATDMAMHKARPHTAGRVARARAAATHAGRRAAPHPRQDLVARVNARLLSASDASATPSGGEQEGARTSAAHGAAAESTSQRAGFSRDSPEDRCLLISLLLHAADLCTPLFPPPVSRRISDELSVEFARQAELERAQGLPVTVMIAHDDVGKAKVRTLATRRQVLCDVPSGCSCAEALERRMHVVHPTTSWRLDS